MPALKSRPLEFVRFLARTPTSKPLPTAFNCLIGTKRSVRWKTLRGMAEILHQGSEPPGPNGATASSPRLARGAYLGNKMGEAVQPCRGCGPKTLGHNPFRVDHTFRRPPRVAARRQPWAACHSPVRAGRNVETPAEGRRPFSHLVAEPQPNPEFQMSLVRFLIRDFGVL